MPKPVDYLRRAQTDLIKITAGVETDQSSTAAQFSGVAVIASGGTTIVVSTTVVKSNAAIFLTGFSNVASHIDNMVSVQSITDSNQFTIRAEAATTDSYRVGWVIFNALT